MLVGSTARAVTVHTLLSLVVLLVVVLAIVLVVLVLPPASCGCQLLVPGAGGGGRAPGTLHDVQPGLPLGPPPAQPPHLPGRSEW